MIMELPPEIHGPSAWYGPDSAGRGEWIEPLLPAELAEIELASRQLRAVGTRLAEFNGRRFSFAYAGWPARHILDTVLNDRGFVLLRGLPVEHWGRRLSAAAFLGLGLHWGNLAGKIGEDTSSDT